MKRTIAIVVGVLLLSLLRRPVPTAAQVDLPGPPPAPSSAVAVDEADSPVRKHLEGVRQFLADAQWEEAVETLRRVMEDFGDKMIRLDLSKDYRDAEGQFPRYVSVRDYCQLRLVRLYWEAPQGLALYRRLVDPVAERWYRQGVKRRDAMLLSRVADRLLASSFGDDALYALGEMALERGDYTAARTYWERTSPALRSPPRREKKTTRAREGRPLWLAFQQDRTRSIDALLAPDKGPTSWPAYPDTDLKLADVRARLVLVSILEGSLDRARFELDVLRRLDPDARGRLGGREVKYVEALSALVDESKDWPEADQPPGWSTFAGAAGRNRIAAEIKDFGAPRWSVGLGGVQRDAGAASEEEVARPKPVAEDAIGRLRYHPVVVGDLLLVGDRADDPNDPQQVKDRIRAFQLATGKPAWPGGEEPGEFFVRRRPRPVSGGRAQMGARRFTMTVFGDKLFARLGAPETGLPVDEEIPREQGYLVGLDLATQGRRLDGFPIRPDGYKWAFEGSPVTDGKSLYMAMRRSGVRPQAHVACYDVQTGALRWRRFVSEADTPAHGRFEERTHNLLTLAGETIYFGTNLGAVAALRARDGAIRWITLYPRTKMSLSDWQRGAARYYRDLNPCVFYKGLLFAAPWDCDLVFALDAATGQMIWADDRPRDVAYLLGAGGGNLIVSGNRLWWLDAYTGENVARFPEQDRPDSPAMSLAQPSGFGRGLLSGNRVYWPTREQIYVFDQRTAQQVRPPIDLVRRGVTGGNLTAAGGRLILTTGERLFVFGEF